MPYAAFHLIEDELIVLHGWGRITSAEIIDAVAALKESPDFRPDLDRLIIYDERSIMSELDLNALGKLKTEFHSQASDRLQGKTPATPLVLRVAVVCNDRMKFIVLKLYTSLLEVDPKVDVPIEMFPSVGDALAWLGKPDANIPMLPNQ